MTEPAKRSISPRMQLLGRNLVLQLHMVVRTMKIHDANNQALLVATENLKDTINTLWAAFDGSVQLQFVDGTVYLNDTRLRLGPSTREHVLFVQEQFLERGMGGIGFSRPVDTSALHEFLVAFSRPIESPEDLEAFRASLQEMKELALSLLDPARLNDELDEQEFKIDRRTFALQTYAKAIIATKEFVRALREGEDPNKVRLGFTRIVQDLVDIATERVNFMLKLSAIKTANEYPFNHAANVCVLSLVIGRALEVDRVSLVDLGTSALLADIGFALLPDEMMARHGEWNEGERERVNEAMIRQVRSIIGTKQVTDSIMKRVIVAFEHHLPFANPETGEIYQRHLFSRIVSVTDAFDALTTRRPWREGYAADEALKILINGAGTRYDPSIVRVLVNLMGIYPLGSFVRLQSGEIALVYHNSNDPRFFEKPWVKVIAGPDGARIRRTLIRNLADTAGPQGQIVQLVPAHQMGLDGGIQSVS